MKRVFCLLTVLVMLFSLVPEALAEEESIETLKQRIEELEAQLLEKDARIAELMEIIVSLNSKSQTANTESQNAIELTKDNIKKYIRFDGEFSNSRYDGKKELEQATLEFQAYPVVQGQFNNVEITLRVSSYNEYYEFLERHGYYWHLAGTDSSIKNIELSFSLGADGRFSKNYSVECSTYIYGDLIGSGIFEVVSVKGSYIPE